MSSTVSSGQAAGTGRSGQPGHRRRAGRWWLVAVVLVVVAGVVGAAVAGAFGTGSPGSGSPVTGYRTSTAPVQRRTLVAQMTVNATLGDSGSYSVVNQAAGTLTSLPAVGQIVSQGQVLYQVSGSPVVLLKGTVPAYRDLSEGVTPGPDVTELNADLVRLGYATRALLGPRSGWDVYSAETAYAVELLQTALGITSPTGSLALGDAVFLPVSSVKVTALSTGVALGTAATPAAAVLTVTSTVPVVTIKLDSADQGEVKAGDKVTITLPNGQGTPGVIASVGTVATSGSSGSTITVLVALTDPKAAGQLDQAPVTVSITTGGVSNVLVVPVAALLARASGGYAVEVTGPGGHHLVRVNVGMFDDAAGVVQVSGAGLAAGQRVVVPQI
ncbi:MAG TPA: HlyD family efflux transporter periplasmic adaptor subunit [Streptosporangiaceae bacterium]